MPTQGPLMHYVLTVETPGKGFRLPRVYCTTGLIEFQPGDTRKALYQLLLSQLKEECGLKESITTVPVCFVLEPDDIGTSCGFS